MRYRDMLLRDRPKLVDKLFRGGCSGCPCDYGYEEGLWCKENPRRSCDDCWDREEKEDERSGQ